MRAGQKQQTTLSVRVTRNEEQLLRRVARRRRTTVSNVIREAVSTLAAEEERKPLRPYDQIADLIGVVNDLPADLSERTGERFAEMLRTDRTRRRK